jgi:hypothetical protein
MKKTKKKEVEPSKEVMDSLLDVQDVFGQLGFTLTGDQRYYKDYATGEDTTIRLTPQFDRGTPFAQEFKLNGFHVTTQTFVPIVDGQPMPFDRFPRVLTEDLSTIFARLTPSSRMPLKESFLITVPCDGCGKEASSFFQVKGTFKCLKCMGYED